MYLVLTAMLALNVSADVLEAFTKVQQSLSSAIIGFERKNSETYNEIEMAYSLNENKVGATRDKALKIKDKTLELSKFIDSLKVKMVKIVDGPDGDVDNIKARDNLDVGGQIMLVEGQGKELKKRLSEYRDLVVSYINPKDSILRATIEHSLNTDNPPAHDGEFKSWESAQFESTPLAGVVTMLTMYQVSILTSESDVLRYLVASVDAESFKFNKLEALIIPDSKYVLTGDQFKARIMLAAVDTTLKPAIIANGRQVKYDGLFGIYTEPATKVGIHKIRGVINYISSSGQTLPRTFETEYEVADPAVVISPTKMNVFYLGVDNPVSIAVPGMSADLLQPEISNGEIIKQGNDYVVRPKNVGKASVSVYAQIGNTRKLLQNQEFRVKAVPDPVAKIANQKEGKIARNKLLAAGKLTVELENFDFDMKFQILSFTLSTLVDGYVRDADTKGDGFSEDQKRLIRDLKRNQPLFVEQIMVQGPDGTRRKLSSISFKIE